MLPVPGGSGTGSVGGALSSGFAGIGAGSASLLALGTVLSRSLLSMFARSPVPGFGALGPRAGSRRGPRRDGPRRDRTVELSLGTGDRGPCGAVG